jgi:hypothetical protein
MQIAGQQEMPQLQEFTERPLEKLTNLMESKSF